jgi:hypothetical protein
MKAEMRGGSFGKAQDDARHRFRFWIGDFGMVIRIKIGQVRQAGQVGRIWGGKILGDGV